jgi:hypothetical protein
MRARPRTRPSSTHPTIHTLQLSGVIKRDDAVDLAIGMLVVLASIFVDRVHPDGGDAEIACCRGGQADLAAAVAGAVERGGCYPAFFLIDGLPDRGGEDVVVGCARAVVSV